MAQIPGQKKRGPKQKPVDYAKVEALAARGMDKKDIAACIGMSPMTLFRRQLDDPKFSEAMDRGIAAGIAAVTAQLLKQISLGNMTGIIFYLKCRAGWKETSIVLNGDAPPIPDDNCSAEESEAAYIAAMRAPR